LSAELVAEVALATVTVTSTLPVPEGLVAVQVVAELQLTEVPAVLPKLTVVAPEVVEKLVPVIVTEVPPAAGPEVGLMALTVGAEDEDGALPSPAGVPASPVTGATKNGWDKKYGAPEKLSWFWPMYSTHSLVRLQVVELAPVSPISGSGNA